MQEVKVKRIKTLMVFAKHNVCCMKPLVYMLHQDDPFKCTAAKLVKFRLAMAVKFISRTTIVLDPFSEHTILRRDQTVADSICAIDCSWERADEVLKHRRVTARGIARRLPAMLAANPTNYAKLGKLSSVEALAGALYILNEKELAIRMMDKFKWGHTFLQLNANLLDDYAAVETEEQVIKLEEEYFPQMVRNYSKRNNSSKN
jgi:pre-rRNA-processing protein TSR3